MKYKNSKRKKSKNTFALEVVCGSCKEPILIYEKGGKGNLIKLQSHRIIESEFNLKTHKGHLKCLICKELLANRGIYNDKLTYFIVRGKVNSKKLSKYSY